jgi:type II secretory pathway component PulC
MIYQKQQQRLRLSVLTKFLNKVEMQRNQLLPLLAIGLVSLVLLVAVVVEKTQERPEIAVIDKVRSPAKLTFNWFGGEAKPQKEIDLANIPENLPMANINAQLLGIVLAGDESTATIKFGGSKEIVHFIGDKIEGQTKIVDIQSYRIVVLQGGVNKQMVMKKPDTIIEQTKGSAKSEGSPSSGFAFANMFGAVPVMAGGSSGFKINDLSAEVQSLADIREGDVVIGVDGASMQDIMADPTRWMKFSASSNLPVTVLRDGQKQIIYINASSLSAKIMPNLGFKP